MNVVSPNLSKYFKVFYAKNPAVIPIVVGNDAAQTPCEKKKEKVSIYYLHA